MNCTWLTDDWEEYGHGRMCISLESGIVMDFDPSFNTIHDLDLFDRNKDLILALPLMNPDKYHQLLSKGRLLFVASPF